MNKGNSKGFPFSYQNPRVVLVLPPTTLVRGRALPEEAGRGVEVVLLLAVDEDEELPEGLVVVEGLLLVEGLLPDEGVPPDAGLALVEGLAVVEGELVAGAEGFDAGGGVAWATGSPPPL